MASIDGAKIGAHHCEFCPPPHGSLPGSAGVAMVAASGKYRYLLRKDCILDDEAQAMAIAAGKAYSPPRDWTLYIVRIGRENKIRYESGRAVDLGDTPPSVFVSGVSEAEMYCFDVPLAIQIAVRTLVETATRSPT